LLHDFFLIGLISLKEFIQNLQILNVRSRSFIIISPFFMVTDILQDVFSFFGVAPEFRILGFFFLLFDVVQFLIQVKVTSSRLRAFYPVL